MRPATYIRVHIRIQANNKQCLHTVFVHMNMYGVGSMGAMGAWAPINIPNLH